jgi:hypothetical protein
LLVAALTSGCKNKIPNITAIAIIKTEAILLEYISRL